MEFLRFGSSIPGAYWGCCAMDIIQNMKVDPDTKQSIGLINGDSGHLITEHGEPLYIGLTYGDIFRSRMIIDSMSTSHHPDHAFLCTMTSSQINTGVGAKWLKILAEEGFEFVATVDNSVYSGDIVIDSVDYEGVSSHENYLFACFRNIGTGSVDDPRLAPSAWRKLKTVDAPVLTPERRKEINTAQREWHMKRWHENLAKHKTYTLQQLYAHGLTDEYIRVPGTQMRNALPKQPVYQETRYERNKKIPYPKANAVKADPFAPVAAKPKKATAVG